MKIIWIDDEIMSDKELIGTLDEMKGIFKDKNISIEGVERVGDAHVEISGRACDFAIVDLNFIEEKHSSDNLLNILHERGIYYAIYSSLINGGTRTNYGSNSFCVGVYKKYDDKEKLLKSIKNFISEPPYRILQISDIHYDLNMSKTNRGRLLESLIKTITEINSEQKINIITILGDMVSKRPAEELPIIRDEFFEEVFMKLNIHRDCIFIVPGNHEVQWNDYENHKLSEKPYAAYTEFYNSIYDKNTYPINACKGSKEGRLLLSSEADDLSWHRKLKEFKVSMIGVCSNSDNPKERGEGRIKTDVVDYVRKKWSSDSNGEIRIFLLHHNLFQIESFFKGDERRTVHNTGEVLKALVESGCDIILSGHSHRPEVIMHQSSSFEDGGFRKNKSLLLICSGTSGGNAPSGDINKHFNIIDISKSAERGNKCVKVTPYAYNSGSNTWSKKTYDDYDI